MKVKRLDSMEHWANGGYFSNDSIEHAAIQNAFALGGIKVLNEFIVMSPETFGFIEKEEDENGRSEDGTNR